MLSCASYSLLLNHMVDMGEAASLLEAIALYTAAALLWAAIVHMTITTVDITVTYAYVLITISIFARGTPTHPYH